MKSLFTQKKLKENYFSFNNNTISVTSTLRYLFGVVLLFGAGLGYAQGPNVSYSGRQTYTANVVFNPPAPVGMLQVNGFDEQNSTGAVTPANNAILSGNANLSLLKLNPGIKNPVFMSSVTSYTVSVVNGVKSTIVTPTATDPNATIKVNGTTVASGTASGAIPLNAGPNTISVVVIAEDGITTKTYTVVVTRAPSNNALLNSLSLSHPFAALTTVSGPDYKDYTASVANSVNSILVTPVTGVSTSTVTINGTMVASGSPSSPISLTVGQNIITTIVTAQDGVTIKKYVITVTKAPSNNCSLSNISLTHPYEPLTTVSGPDYKDFTASVPNSVTSILVTPVTAVPTSIVTINGTTVLSGNPSNPIPLAAGPNTITTVVKAQDGVSTKTYKITVTRASLSVATLSALAISSGTLSPAFSSGTTAYTASVANAISSVYFTPTSTDPKATIRINGIAVTSGSPSASISLSAGQNIITVAVTGQGGSPTDNYTITVTRAPSNVATLSALSISGGTLSPAFASGTNTYTASVANGASSIIVGPTSSNAAATIKVNGVSVQSGSATNIPLSVGPNTINVVVTAQDGTTTDTYTITVTRALSNVATLSALQLNSGPISPVFASGTNNYTASAANGASSLIVTPTSSNAAATIKVNGAIVASGSASAAIPLSVGTNTITVAVTSQDGTTTDTYTITVTRAPSNVATLSALQLSTHTLSPAFAPGTSTYTDSVANSTSSITVTPTSTVSAATIKVNGAVVASGSASAAIPLSVGHNTITITVTAQDGTTTDTYTITVTRELDDYNYISSVQLQNPTAALTQSSTNPQDFTATVANTVTSVEVVVTLPLTDETATVNGTAVASGSASAAIPLSTGPNTITIIVTAQDGETRTYIITVTRTPSSDITLSALQLSSGSLTPVFSPGATSYTASVGNGTASVTVTPTAANSASTLKVNGVAVASGSASASIPLSVGQNTITIVDTAPDGMSSYTYTISVTRAPSSNAALSALHLSNGTLNPGLALGTNSYSAAVANTISSITVTPTTADATATVKVNGTAVTSGSASGPVTLAAGPNVITVISTAADGVSSETYTITVTRVQPINAGAATGTISACAGTPSASPNIERFVVFGAGLTANITATPPADFEVSLAAGSGYGSSVTLTETAGTVDSTWVYVRSAADPAGQYSGSVILSSTGVASLSIPVSAMVNALPSVNPVANQIVANGAATAAVNFAGAGNTFNWVNDTPGIGLAASGTGNIASFTAVNTGSSPVTATITVSPELATGFAYIANGASNSVSVVNTLNNTVATTIHLPGAEVSVGFASLAMSPDGSHVYVTGGEESNTLAVISTATNTVTAEIAVETGPANLVISPDGTRAYVVNSNSGTVSVINTLINSVIANIGVGLNPNLVFVSPDGSRLYATSADSNDITVINTATNTVLFTIALAVSPAFIAISPDGSRLYVTNYSNNNIYVINASAGSVAATIAAGTTPYNLILSPDGSTLYVGNASSVSVINTATNAVTATVTLAANAYPSPLILSADGSHLYTANSAKNTVSVINTATNTVVATVPVGNDPSGLSLSPDGSRAYAVNNGSDNVSVINTATNTIVATVAAGQGPNSFNNFVIGSTGCDGGLIKFTITVNPASGIAMADDGVLVHSGISPNGDGVNDFLQIDNISQYPDNKLSVMNRNGQLIFEAKSYDNSSKVFDGHSNRNGQMQLPGTYFYALDYTVKGILKHKTGFIVLKY